MNILSIKDLHATVDGKEILKGINLEMGAGEIHAIIGSQRFGKIDAFLRAFGPRRL
jgi:Fe-S cluster assembly ATP-binding protein